LGRSNSGVGLNSTRKATCEQRVKRCEIIRHTDSRRFDKLWTKQDKTKPDKCSMSREIAGGSPFCSVRMSSGFCRFSISTCFCAFTTLGRAWDDQVKLVLSKK